MTLFFVLRGWGASFLRWLVTPSEQSFIDGEKRRKSAARKSAQELLRRG